MRFRTLEDGTILYRRSRSTRTYVITNEQRDQISKLHRKEISVAFLLAPPILAFGLTSLEGDFGLVWQITGVYTLIYFVFIFIYSKSIFTEIDIICQEGRTGSPKDEIIIMPFWDNFRNVYASKKLSEKILISIFSLLIACISFLVAYSAIFDIYFLQNLGFHWVASLLIGLAGMFLFGLPIVASMHNILEKRAGKKNV